MFETREITNADRLRALHQAFANRPRLRITKGQADAVRRGLRRRW